MSTDTTPLSSTPRTRLRRHHERGMSDRDALYEVLDAGLICHLGVVADGVPVVLPTAYGRDGDTLYLHGSSANGAFGAAAGQQVCVTVTHMDGIVCARSVFSHSMNYRSAVVFGTATLVRDEDERWQALRLITDHLIPGRWAAARQPTRKEMAATAVLSLPLTEASVKVRTGMPGRRAGGLRPGRLGRGAADGRDVRPAGAGPGHAPGNPAARAHPRPGELTRGSVTCRLRN